MAHLNLGLIACESSQAFIMKIIVGFTWLRLTALNASDE
jgi:hypothetical protein|nr:MAG TPA: hypothetical protein [Crassvirales sp.]